MIIHVGRLIEVDISNLSDRPFTIYVDDRVDTTSQFWRANIQASREILPVLAPA
jgi:hypothetical protein